ncbi:amidohydrolase family protein [Candidatus Latescibacterota bacterium]
MNRRNFIKNILTGSALTGAAAGISLTSCGNVWQMRNGAIIRESGKYDILIKGGHVVDPANNRNEKLDVAVIKNKIATVNKNIPSEFAKKTIDANGLFVTPGFVDPHVHVVPGYHGWVNGDDVCFQSGVTTVLDVGSSGAGTFEKIKADIIDKSKLRIFALLNISSTGMDENEQNPAFYKIDPMVETARRYRDVIIGFKTAHYWTTRPYDQIHTPWASVDALLEAGKKADLMVMFDFYPRPASDGYPERSYRELILKKGRPGDVHTHVFAKHIPVIREDGSINPDLFKAQERGFKFDVGHGAGSMVFRNAIPALEQGFLPDTMGTDLHDANINGPVVNMANVMSKFLAMGVKLEDVIRMSTIEPARIMNQSDLGSLKTGNPADIAVFDLQKGAIEFLDTSGGKIRGDRRIFNMLTIAGGSIEFDPYGLSYPYWKDIPKGDTYWINPSGQPY